MAYRILINHCAEGIHIRHQMHSMLLRKRLCQYEIQQIRPTKALQHGPLQYREVLKMSAAYSGCRKCNCIMGLKNWQCAPQLFVSMLKWCQNTTTVVLRTNLYVYDNHLDSFIVNL